jgi:hypothetical protein
MAGDWLQWKKGLTNKREVRFIASTLERPRQEIAGRLMELWEWVDDQVSDADIDANDNASFRIGPKPLAHIDDIAGIVGFGTAMLSAGWLRIRNAPAGDIVEFPNFARHNGKSAKERALAASRQRKKRVTQVSRCDRDASSLLSSSPEWLRKVWTDWTDYRRERGLKPYADTGAVRQLRVLLDWGEARTAAAIDFSIRQNYQGIYEPKDTGMGQPQAKPADMDEAFKIADQARRRPA